jgi:hypothetical protein
MEQVNQILAILEMKANTENLIQFEERVIAKI